jgi:hypothetical protein
VTPHHHFLTSYVAHTELNHLSSQLLFHHLQLPIASKKYTQGIRIPSHASDWIASSSSCRPQEASLAHPLPHPPPEWARQIVDVQMRAAKRQLQVPTSAFDLKTMASSKYSRQSAKISNHRMRRLSSSRPRPHRTDGTVQ